MFTVELFGSFSREEAVHLKKHGGAAIKICFDFTKTIELPFAPYPGLEIEIPSISDDDDPINFKIEAVTWNCHFQRFECRVEDTECKYPDIRSMIEDADELENCGFTVDRTNLCEGQW